MLEVGNKVEIKMINTIGEVLELDDSAVLVKHNLIIDGQSKIVNQWYTRDICSEVEETVELEPEIV